MPEERRQCGVLYRDFLFRLVDLELLSAAGGVEKLLGQFAAMLAAFSFTITIFSFPRLAMSRLPFDKLMAAAHIEQEFLIATTMAIAGLFSVLAWNAVFPDRRDSLVLGLLPVRIRTIFLAKLAAIATALGVSIAAVNIFTGLTFPFVAGAPGGGLAGGLRAFGAHWITLAAAGLFVCCALLSLQGLAAHLLTYRLMLRISSVLQLGAFFAILGLYFLKPSFASVSGPPAWVSAWMPSFWFCGLLQVLNGASDPLFAALASRALWGLLLVVSVALGTLGLSYGRNLRRIIEQPDIAPADRSRRPTRILSFLASKLLVRSLERAILLFTGRTIARSRQHRLLLAAYGGIGLAIALAYARDFLYGTSSFETAYRDLHWNHLNGQFLAGSLVLLFFAVIGARAVFAMPIALRANWIFPLTAVHSPAAYSASVRRSLFALTAIPLWILSAALFFAIWPVRFAGQHMAVMIVIGILLVEVAMHRFQKIPFACSYLPGKARIHTRVGTVGIGFLLSASLGVQIEFWAMHGSVRFAVMYAILLAAAFAAWRRTAEFARSPANRLQFEDLPPAEVSPLDLREQTYADAFDR